MATVYENYVSTLNFLKEANAPEEMISFIDGRISQLEKNRELAKERREKKNGGEKKDIAQSDFYSGLRDSIYKVMTTEFQTGDSLVEASDFVSSSGKKPLAAQVAVALKPLVADGTVIVGEVKVSTTDKQGLIKESLRKAYRLA